MFVIYKCEACDAEVNSELEHCPKCGVELPEMTLERDYDAEIDEELYELEHPTRTKLKKLFEPYVEHLWGVVEEEAELDESVERKAEEIMNEKGAVARRWYKVKRKLGLIAFSLGYLVWIILAIILLDYIANEKLGYLLFGITALIPLYGVSVWLLVQNDKRDITIKQKVLHNALGAFNKLIFGILYVVIAFFIITTINRFIFSY